MSILIFEMCEVARVSLLLENGVEVANTVIFRPFDVDITDKGNTPDMCSPHNPVEIQRISLNPVSIEPCLF